MGNRYLEDVFAPLAQEHTLIDLEVEGEIPEYLDGRYLRNGPNPIGEVDPLLYHWFIGDGMVHGIRIRDGKAEWYRNRWVRGPQAARVLGERPPRGHYGGSPIGANTNVIGHAGKTLALVEAGLANYELTDELDTVGVCDFYGTLTGGYTAHPKRDPDTGELHAVSYSMSRGNTVQYSVIGADGRARRTVDIEVTGSPMMHDFSLTERHVVFYDLPVTFDVRQATAMTVPRGLRLPARLVLSALIGRVRVPDPVSARQPLPKEADRRFPYSWNPRYPARVGVMPRDGAAADVRWFDVEPCYVFHPMNAYEDGDTIVLDVIRHPKMFATDHLGPNEGPPTLDRWTVDLADGKIRESRIDDRGQEFPRVDERRVGKRHRYGYAPAVGDRPTGSDMLIKHDLAGGGTLTRSFGDGKVVGEFVFESSSPDAAEDDGVLMGYVYDRSTDRSALAILDAQTLQDVAVVRLPHRVPAGFHGNWVPSAR
ncbi:carotenoid oxygenase family protein [Mycolicibacterium litorale]|uniref:Dioxygenase n=1 Tax=Mycolicibacterium litorale TaxID=758802 RepID=A0AAD1MWW6_9MYCO|nr:carotenoid oxygenase family protein [Mycolicibacterium litorale]MCV7417974.1 carotenoid oxygenase family protein [Mycolicibacterium litorale]TDY06638.1 carotenoid cleavage dioxygenase [Mycolicibacterium litorale]BBY19213.1 carotenoid cleavage dioxygenase [Mycolicibacterium litorale]